MCLRYIIAMIVVTSTRTAYNREGFKSLYFEYNKCIETTIPSNSYDMSPTKINVSP